MKWKYNTFANIGYDYCCIKMRLTIFPRPSKHTYKRQMSHCVKCALHKWTHPLKNIAIWIISTSYNWTWQLIVCFHFRRVFKKARTATFICSRFWLSTLKHYSVGFDQIALLRAYSKLFFINLINLALLRLIVDIWHLIQTLSNDTNNYNCMILM